MKNTKKHHCRNNSKIKINITERGKIDTPNQTLTHKFMTGHFPGRYRHFNKKWRYYSSFMHGSRLKCKSLRTTTTDAKWWQYLNKTIWFRWAKITVAKIMSPRLLKQQPCFSDSIIGEMSWLKNNFCFCFQISVKDILGIV